MYVIQTEESDLSAVQAVEAYKDLTPIFHKPIQIAGSIFINWQIISHFRQVHGVVGL
jgi:hypothetical protein